MLGASSYFIMNWFTHHFLFLAQNLRLTGKNIGKRKSHGKLPIEFILLQCIVIYLAKTHLISQIKAHTVSFLFQGMYMYLPTKGKK